MAIVRKPKKITTADIEVEVARYFNPRQKIIIPNVSWSFFYHHECDLLVVRKNGYATEVEIKISKADLKADLKKKHQHKNNKIKDLYFAIPESLLEHKNLIPKQAGILVVRYGNLVTVERKPKSNKAARKLTIKEQLKLLHLGAMRIWKLKSKIRELKDEAKRNSADGGN